MVKYSFVIPTYNKKRLLKNTLEALNYQNGFSKDDYEVIICDDGSTDSTKEFIDGVDKNYNLRYIYIERDENSCRSRTRNVGLEMAQGEIMIFIDSDIIVKKDYLEQIERCFSVEKNILVFGTILYLQEEIKFDSLKDGSIHNKYYFDINKPNLWEDRHFTLNKFSYNASNHLLIWALVYSGNMAMRKESLQDIGGFDVDYKNWGFEDIDLGYRAFINNVKLVYNYKLEVMHQHHLKDVNANKETIINNIELFYQKHPEALSFLPNDIRIQMLSGSAINKDHKNRLQNREAFMDNMQKNIEKIAGEHGFTKKVTKEINIDFKERKEYDAIKTRIIELLNQNDVSITVNDFVESTDLDIWVQLLPNKMHRLKYYPASRCFAK